MEHESIEQLMQACRNRIIECFHIANAKYSTNLPAPTIRFDLRGRVAGWAHTDDNVINLNLALLRQEKQRFIDDTPGHEAAHIIANKVLGVDWVSKGMRMVRASHGAKWRAVMMLLGQDAKRCHNFDVSAVKIARGGAQYCCESCGVDVVLGVKQHRNAVAGLQFNRYYRHRCSGRGRLILKDAPTVVRLAVPKSTPTIIRSTDTPSTAATPSARAGMTKLQIANRVLHELRSSAATRSQKIQAIMTEAGLTKAVASTYYQKLYKEHLAV